MPKNVKVFVVQMPLSPREPHIGVAQLYGFLRHTGIAAEVFDVSTAMFHLEKNRVWSEETWPIWEDEAFCGQILEKHKAWIETNFLEPILQAEAPVVGFSLYMVSLFSSYIMARWIKERRPDAVVVFGGQMFSTNRRYVESVLQEPAVDAVIRGEGEHALAELAKNVALGRAVSSSKGLFMRGPAGETVFTGTIPPPNLDELPFADYSAFDLAKYGNHRVKGYDILLMASRGCSRHCAFCGLATGWPGFRQMSGERVYAEIKHQMAAIPKLGEEEPKVKFYDLLINGDMAKLNRLCDLLIADKGRKLDWEEANAIIRPEMTEEICRKMYQAGCRSLIIGVESGSQNVLDRMWKGQTIEQAKIVLRNIDRSGLKTRANFMFGFPGETEEDFEQTLDFLTEMAPYMHSVHPSFAMTALDGPLNRNPQQFGLDPNQHVHFWRTQDGTNTYPIRLERFHRFRERAVALGVPLADGMEMTMENFIDFSLGTYYEEVGEFSTALSHFKKFLQADPTNSHALERVAALGRKV